MSRPLLVNTYTWNEVRIWCELFWGKHDDLEIQEMDVHLYQSDPEPRKPKRTPKFTFEEVLDKPGQFKFDPEPAVPLLGIAPAWYIYDIREIGLTEVIYPSSLCWPDHFLDPWAYWGLVNGVAPRQPFLLRIPRPHYPAPDYWGEYDGPDYDHEVVDRLPISDRHALKKWETFLNSYDIELETVR